MITSFKIRNFRSIESADILLAPITVLYGPTGSGKSSVLYAPMVLRNFIMNPNRPANLLFHLGFLDLGGFNACVFNHESKRSVTIAVTLGGPPGEEGMYALILSENKAIVFLARGALKLKGEVSVPYNLNMSFAFGYVEQGAEYTINWNGIWSKTAPKDSSGPARDRAQEIASRLNELPEAIKAIDIAPHRRGFFQPNYVPAAVSEIPTSDDEVASLIINDPHLPARISVYTEEIFGRDFRLHVPPGTATAFFQVTEKRAKVPTLVVNDGFGVNQIIYLLAKMHRSDVQTILIEEPEVHLHPTVLRNFARAMCTFVKEERKQLVLTTHSEPFLAALLSAVAEGLIEPTDLRCYLATKEKRATVFKAQKVDKTGQIEGGLASFVEAELEDLRKFLGIKES